jgi:hypothetical protein
MPSTLEKLISLARRGREKNRNICPNGYVSLPVDGTRVDIFLFRLQIPNVSGMSLMLMFPWRSNSCGKCRIVGQSQA